MNGISALIYIYIKGGARQLVSSLFVTWGHKSTVLSERMSRTSPDNESASTLNLDFLAPRTVRNKCLLFKPVIYGIFVTAAQIDSASKSAKVVAIVSSSHVLLCRNVILIKLFGCVFGVDKSGDWFSFNPLDLNQLPGTGQYMYL